MGRLSALLLALLLGGASVTALVACGSGSDAKLLPGTTASQIESNLDQVQQLVAEGDCIGAEDAVAEVAAEVEDVNVATKLKAALREGTTKLSEVVGRCEEETGEEEEAEPSEEADVEAEEAETEAELKAEEKAEEKAEKLQEKEEKAEEKAEAPEAEEKELPPQANGEAKGHEEEASPATPTPTPEAGEKESSGGVSPGVGVE
jgi:hypothetical protein